MNERKFDRELKFTEAYKQNRDKHPALREAACIKAQYPGFFSAILPGDLFAGRINNPLAGFSPDEWGSTAFGYYCVKDEILRIIDEYEFSDNYRGSVLEMVRFWQEESTSAKLRAAYPTRMAEYLPSDDWMNSSGIAFPLYRLTGGNVNFGKLIKLGLPGLRAEITKYRTAAAEQHNGTEFYDASLIILDVFEDLIRHYINEAEKLASVETDKKRKEELIDISSVLELNLASPPKTFREGLQLFWLYSLAGDIRNYGRMDVYMGDLLAADLDNGTLTEEKALDLLESLWQLMADRNTVVHGRVIIGGKGRPNENNADRFAMLSMEASRRVKEIEPQLSLRIYEGMNEKLLEKALDVLGEGRTFPILYNDDVNINAIVKAFEFPQEEAENYVPFGCGEYILDHRSFNTPSGVINLLKALEVTLRNGDDPLTGQKAGLETGRFEDFRTFEDLWKAYKKQVEFFVDLTAEQEEIEYKIAGETAPFLFMSILYDGCLEKGKWMFQGGIPYLDGTLETYGNTSAADSLLAIKKLVYDEKKLNPAQILKILDANFEGYEKERRMMVNLPKYGNDDPEADDMLLRVHNHVCNYVRSQKNRRNLHAYLVVIINNSANTLMGRQTMASVDGRKAFTPMNNGNNPTGGYDRSGVTAFLNSIAKPDPAIHAGAVQNMKFGKDMFTTHREKLKALLQTYWQNGGTQAMITVVDRGELEKALEEPEKYQNLFVRVGGFTARFVELDKGVQQDILSRTIY